MSNVAVGEDGKNHYADDFSDTYSGKYFCPNGSCKANMVLKNIGSDEKTYGYRKPYFSATKTSPHMAGCEYCKNGYSYKNLDTENFKCDTFFANLLNTKNNESSTTASNVKKENNADLQEKKHVQNKLTTVNKLYTYCLQHSDYSLLPDGKKVFEIYQEKRNENIFNSKRSNFRLVKLNFTNCNFTCYDEEKGCYKVWCYFPHTEKSKPPAIYYTLGFKDLNLMMHFCDILSQMKKKNDYVPIVVGGEWKNNHCSIKSKKQIFILNKT